MISLTVVLLAFGVLDDPRVPELNQKVVQFARERFGQQVGNGECWTLAAEALKEAGAKRDGVYIFGRKLSSNEAIFAGDVVQFENTKFEGKHRHSFHHHTSIVNKVLGPAMLELIHQNVGKAGKTVSLSTIDLRELKEGTVEIFRPRVKGDNPAAVSKSAAGQTAKKPDLRIKFSGPPDDLLELINPEIYSIEGTWQMDGDALVSPLDQRARLQFPCNPPDEYALFLVAERKQGTGSINIGLVAGDSQFQVILDGASPPTSGLDMLDGKRFNLNETAYEGTVITNDKPSTIVCVVRRDGITVTCDDKKLIDWTGDPKRLSLPRQWQVGDRGSFFVATYASNYRITKIELAPIGGSKPVAAKTSQPQPPESGPADLLNLIDPQRDGVKGTWLRNGADLVSLADEYSRIQIPYMPPDEYDLEISVTREDGNDTFGIGLVMGEHQAMIALDSYSPKVTGLHTLDGKKANVNESTRRVDALKLKTRSKLLCSVRKDKITLTCDDKTILDWSGDPNRLAVQSAFAVPNNRVLFLASMRSVFTIDKIVLTPVTGEGKRLR